MKPETAIVRSAIDLKALAKLEAKVDSLEASYIDVGRALDAIRQLFRAAGSDAFEDHCYRLWGWARGTVYEKLQAAEIAAQVRTFGPVPGNKEVAMSLAPLAEADRRKVWKQVAESARGRITADTVSQAVAAFQLADPAGRIQQLGLKALAGMDAEDVKAIIEGEEKKTQAAAPSHARPESGQAALLSNMIQKCAQLAKLIDRWEGDRDVAAKQLKALLACFQE